MKIRVTFEVDDEVREAINNHYGKPGKADYEQTKQFLIQYGESAHEDITWELMKAKAEDSGDE